MSTSLSREIQEILLECLTQDEEKWEEAVETVCRERPELAGGLRRAFGAVKRIPAGPHFGDDTNLPERFGEFRPIRRLGQGGMGIVYLAEQESLGRQVALKIIRPDFLYVPELRERFRREAEAVSRLSHPGIVPIHSVGVERAIPFIAMEWIPGCTLADALRELERKDPAKLTGADLARVVLRRAQPNSGGARAAAPRVVALPPAFSGSWSTVCLRVARQVAEALDHAHARGIFHRDVKPSNVLLTPTGRALLFDFGLAWAAEDEVKITKTGTPLGSPAYMSPEQARGEFGEVDARADVYSLGVTLYEMLALHAPYGEESAEKTREKVLEGRPEPIRCFNRSVSWDEETVCLVAMERDRERRYPTAADFARDLGNALDRRPIEARRQGPWLRAWRFARRNPTWAAAFALTVAGSIGFGLYEKSARREAERLRSEADLARAESDSLRREAEKARAAAEAARIEAVAGREEAQAKGEELEAALGALAKEKDLALEREREAVAASLAAKNVGTVWTSLIAKLVPKEGIKPASPAWAVAFMEREIESRFSEDPRTLGACYHSLGAFCIGLGEFAKAERYLDQAYRTLREHLGDSHLDTAHSQRALAWALRHLGRREESRRHLAEAAEKIKRLLGEEHPQTKATYQQLATY